MTDQYGSTFAQFKKALTDALVARIPNSVAYESPADFAAVMGSDGSGVGVWWLDDTDVTYQINVMTGGPQWYDETYTPTVVVQVIGLDTSDTQYDIDLRADLYTGHVLAILSSDPTVAIALSSADNRNTHAVAATGRIVTGLDAQNMRGCRREIQLEVKSRITVEA